MRLQAARGTVAPVSPLLWDAISVAIAVARDTDGAVDPTIGRAMRIVGYDDDFGRVAAGRDGRPIHVELGPVPGWRAIGLDAGRGRSGCRPVSSSTSARPARRSHPIWLPPPRCGRARRRRPREPRRRHRDRRARPRRWLADPCERRQRDARRRRRRSRSRSRRARSRPRARPCAGGVPGTASYRHHLIDPRPAGRSSGRGGPCRSSPTRASRRTPPRPPRSCSANAASAGSRLGASGRLVGTTGRSPDRRLARAGSPAVGCAGRDAACGSRRPLSAVGAGCSIRSSGSRRAAPGSSRCCSRPPSSASGFVTACAGRDPAGPGS